MKPSPRLLIVAAAYHPFIHPRAHRWTALAEHWATNGWEVHVVCPRYPGLPPEESAGGVWVHRTGYGSLKERWYAWSGSRRGRGRVGAPVTTPGRWQRLAEWLYRAVWKNLYFPDDAMLWRYAARHRARQLLRQQAYDALITVSLPFSGHLVGLDLKRRFPRLPWLADTGDPFSLQAASLNNAFLYARQNRRLEHRVLTAADAVTVTTRYTLEKYRQHFGEASVQRMTVVPPLLHPLPSLPRTGISSQPGLLQIGWFGALYAPVRTPSALLDLLERMLERRPDWKQRLQLHFYGEIFPEFYEALQRQPMIRLHGLRSREECRTAMREMDVLLNIGNTTDFQLPSKAVDYLAAAKPIVHLSYTAEDPFADLIGPGMMRLNVENGKVNEEGLRRWLEYLEERPERPVSPEEWRGRVAPYLVEAVAGGYEAVLRGVGS